MEAWGHSSPPGDGGPSEPHLLAEHLRAVAALTGDFAHTFGSRSWGWLAGLWHDLGKYRIGFQKYIRQTRNADAHIEGRVGGRHKTHSTAGAMHALANLGEGYGRVLAFLIAGHHAGLPDFESADGGGTSLSARMAKNNDDSQREYREALEGDIPADILQGARPDEIGPAAKAGFALWLRMLFSCLVDADFLDTERYFDPRKAAQRGCYPTLVQMKFALDAYLRTMSSRAAENGVSNINSKRAEVLAACYEKAVLPPGFFTLTVPTGGGKTLSSLAFALTHALAHGKRRVVYAIPYTSIIEQTARVFREVFADFDENAVIEHHSNLDVDENKENHLNRLAAENWDAQLIVTTNVQLFESLYAARTSRCRKLHNLVNSVIVLDEAQMLPRDFLAPVLHVLKLLVEHYGVTVVLCTATQPMLASRFEPLTQRKLLDGIDQAQPIIDDMQPLFDALKRVEIHLPDDFNSRRDWPNIATEITTHDCVLAIVNTRKHARDLFKLMPEGALHLSALMCAEHRSAVVAEIRQRLEARRVGIDTRPLRVISTQLVEAGVDLDFPVVYRALAGMDSIAQAAGRCNREGKLAIPGQVHVFVPPQSAPPGLLRQGEQTTREMASTGQLHDPLAPQTFRAYFDRLYAQDADGSFDSQKVLELLKPQRAAFRTAAQKFRLIDNDGESVIVPYVSADSDNGKSPTDTWLAVLDNEGNAGWARRKLQRYTVNVPRKQFEAMLKQGDVEERAGLWVALPIRYDDTFGLSLPDDILSAVQAVF